jgi:hypothetical protein
VSTTLPLNTPTLDPRLLVSLPETLADFYDREWHKQLDQRIRDSVPDMMDLVTMVNVRRARVVHEVQCS